MKDSEFLTPLSSQPHTVGVGIECRYIEFDIEERCPVKDINIFYEKNIPHYPGQADHRYPGRVRAQGSTG